MLSYIVHQQRMKKARTEKKKISNAEKLNANERKRRERRNQTDEQKAARREADRLRQQARRKRLKELELEEKRESQEKQDAASSTEWQKGLLPKDKHTLALCTEVVRYTDESLDYWGKIRRRKIVFTHQCMFCKMLFTYYPYRHMTVMATGDKARVWRRVGEWVPEPEDLPEESRCDHGPECRMKKCIRKTERILKQEALVLKLNPPFGECTKKRYAPPSLLRAWEEETTHYEDTYLDLSNDYQTKVLPVDDNHKLIRPVLGYRHWESNYIGPYGSYEPISEYQCQFCLELFATNKDRHHHIHNYCKVKNEAHKKAHEQYDDKSRTKDRGYMEQYFTGGIHIKSGFTCQCCCYLRTELDVEWRDECRNTKHLDGIREEWTEFCT